MSWLSSSVNLPKAPGMKKESKYWDDIMLSHYLPFESEPIDARGAIVKKTKIVGFFI